MIQCSGYDGGSAPSPSQLLGASMGNVSIKRSRSREERARKVVQGIRQRLKAGHLPDRKEPKGWKKKIRSP
jgi:hypothetical protein